VSAVAVFYDAEFTTLEPDSDLLSIGFVAADSDAELYIEITDCRGHPSDFVKQHVLPLFGLHDPECLTRAQAAVRIQEWLDGLRGGDRTREIGLVSDSAWDWNHVSRLFFRPEEPYWPMIFNVSDIRIQHGFSTGRERDNFSVELQAYHLRHQQQHHALVDARALKYAHQTSFGAGEKA
jgi:hypothetical protein